MAVTVTSICNEALILIGANPITSIDDPDPIADKCRRLYDESRDYLTDMHQWSFSQRRVTLARHANTPPTNAQYKYYYVLPADCLHINEFFGNEQRTYNWTYSVEVTDTEPETTRVLATNATAVAIRYTSALTDPSKFSFRFTNLLKRLLASKLAYPITKDIQLGQALYRQFQIEMESAINTETRENQRDTFDLQETNDREDYEFNPFIQGRW